MQSTFACTKVDQLHSEMALVKFQIASRFACPIISIIKIQSVSRSIALWIECNFSLVTLMTATSPLSPGFFVLLARCSEFAMHVKSFWRYNDGWLPHCYHPQRRTHFVCMLFVMSCGIWGNLHHNSRFRETLFKAHPRRESAWGMTSHSRLDSLSKCIELLGKQLKEPKWTFNANLF